MGKYKWSLVLALILLLLPSIAFAIPKFINYQGKLSDSSGNPVTGDVNITFTIYNAPTGGDSLWTETQTVSLNPKGMFNVHLGKQAELAMAIFDENELYLGIKVGTDSEMSPRQQLTSVPFAFKANQAPTAPTIIAVNAVWHGDDYIPVLEVYFNESSDEEGIYTYYFFRDDNYMEGVGIRATFITGANERKFLDGPPAELTTYCYEISAVNLSYVRSPKSNQICGQSPGYIDNEDGTITQYGTGLMWQQNDDGNTYTWYEANGIYNATYNPTTVDVCGSLTIGGYSDWRLPALDAGYYSDELYHLYDRNNSPSCRPFFNCKPDIYWSSTESGSSGYTLNFDGGFFTWNQKSDSYYVRCVRDIN